MIFGWLTRGLRARVLLTVGVPLFFSLCAGVAVFYALGMAFSAQREVRETGERLETSERLLRLILDAETGQRGFALTGQVAYLEPFETAGKAWPLEVEKLAASFAGEPDQLVRLKRIDSLYSIWLTQVALPVISGRREIPPAHMEAIRDARSALFDLFELRREGNRQPRPARDEAERDLAGRIDLAVDRARDAAKQPRIAELWSEVGKRLAAFEALSATHATIAAEESALSALLSQSNVASEASIAAERSTLAPITSGAGKRLFDGIRKLQAGIAAAERQRLESTLAADAHQGRIASRLAVASLALALGLGLASAFLLAGRLRVALRSIGRAAEKLAAGDLRQRVTEAEGGDLGRLARSFNQLASRVESRDREVALLHDLGQLLQSAEDDEEALRIVGRLVPALVPGASGEVYLISNSRNELVRKAGFGEPGRAGLDHCSSTSCWGLRKGQTYLVLEPSSQLLCEHLSTPAWPYICVPLAAQGQALGILHLEMPTDAAAGRLSAALGLLPTVASEVALALGNLELRSQLRAQSVRDPLTGLFNRRYLEETLTREIDRARRKKLPLTVAMTDLDHFKRLNDGWGHEAGDQVLKRFAELLRAHFRTQDVLCRYGGEEFALVFPDCTIEQAKLRAEGLLDDLRTTEIPYGQSKIRGITASIGMAGFPLQGTTPETLLRNADHALYEAKRGGRDRIQFAPEASSSTLGEDTAF